MLCNVPKKMNYPIIADEQLLKDFIDWLPELLPSEKFYVTLMCRAKYLEDRSSIKGDKAALKRFVSKKDYLFDKIKQLEIELGSYKQQGSPVPREALALYITPNPRCAEKAAKNSLIKLAHVITQPYNGYCPNQLILSEYQKAESRKIYFDIDFDNVTIESVVSKLYGHINMEAVTCLQTRGGFHLLLDVHKIDHRYNKTWYNYITNLDGADVTKADLIPVVGTYQGMYVPKFVNPL